MILDTDQKQAAVELLYGVKTKPVQTLGGYAGTGKTTLVAYLKSVLPNWAVCAYTGKATERLRVKGLDADTIHGTIYKPWTDPITRETVFKLKKKHELGYAGFLIDEASMVGPEQMRDLLSFGVPIIAVGDHGQLPPVGDDAGLMLKPDITLTTLHRNAGPISKFAEHVRLGGDPLEWTGERGDEVYFMSGQQLENTPGMVGRADQVICAFNKTRVTLNRAIRLELGRGNGVDDLPVVGDKVMCLMNDRERGLFNGQQGIVETHDPLKTKIRFVPNRGYPHEVEYVPSVWNNTNNRRSDDRKRKDGKRRKESDPPPPLPFDYAYAITCHKAQGDEWDRVIVFPQQCDLWEFSRWAYTAASRAKKKLVWVV